MTSAIYSTYLRQWDDELHAQGQYILYLCQDQYSACELSWSYSGFVDVADCLEADAGGEAEEWEVQAQLDELSYQLLSASYSCKSGR